MAIRKSDAQFLSDCKQFEVRGITLVDGQSYQGTHHPYKWKCTHDGHIWEAPFPRILKGKGCPICGAKQAGNKNSITKEEFIQRLFERNTKYTPTVSYLGGYVASTKKCMFKCDECGNEWSTLPRTIWDGVGCPECAKKKNADRQTYTPYDVKQLIIQRNSRLPNKRMHIVDDSFDDLIKFEEINRNK